MYDVDKIRADFPILSRQVNGVDLVYLDSGASAQKPQAVIDAVSHAYAHEYSNVHRGLHFLSNLATENYEAVRGKIARFLGVASEEEIILVSNTTMALNLVSYGWAAPRIEPGDEIILSVMEHHANIVPWHFLRERQGAVLRWVDVDVNGDLDPQAVIDAITPKTKLIAVTHMSNVLGTVVDVKTICREARARGVVTVIDGSQAAVHMPVDLEDIGCDFYAVTRHRDRRQPGGGPHAGGSGGYRLRFLRRHSPQAVWPHRFGRAFRPAPAPGRDAALHGRRRHDPRGLEAGHLLQ
jgi:cysteine desulfurase/selenocysteine lyase